MFRIKSFTIHKHPLLGGQTFELTNKSEDKVDNYFSVIIGPNGTGKSYLLNHLIEAFNDITLLKSDETYKPKKKFTIVYSIDESEFMISTENRVVLIELDKKSIGISEVKLPKKWLASSVTINDKYPILNFTRKKQIPQYQYLGIRSATNNAFISRITMNTVLYFLEALRKNRKDKLLSVYKSLSLNPQMQIIFVGGEKLKMEKSNGLYQLIKTTNKIIEPHKLFIQKNESKTNYRVDDYNKHIEHQDKLKLVLDYMKKNQNVFEKKSKKEMQLDYVINLENGVGIDQILKDWPVISIMLDLELIKISQFLITKDAAFKYEEASSGESHLLTSLHGIIANIEDNSLVIIDEPEVSLHPNWQLDYIDILKNIFDGYKGINAVISTHSNLLVTNLKNEESRISSIRRDRETGKIKVEELDFETYGWDPESILYNVFEVATLRNKYFELDLRKLISLISTKSNEKKEIKKLRDKVGKYILSNEDDPLKLLIQEVDKFLNN